MRRWLLLLGGWLVWTAHFAAVYAAASVFDLGPGADAPASRWLVGGLTLAAMAADAALLLLAARPPAFLKGDDDAELSAFFRALGGLGAALSLLAVAWQGLPALVGH